MDDYEPKRKRGSRRNRPMELLLSLVALLGGGAIALTFVVNSCNNSGNNSIVCSTIYNIFNVTQPSASTQPAPVPINGETPSVTSLPENVCKGSLTDQERQVSPGTVAIGDVIVNGERQYDIGSNARYGSPEGTTVYFEVAGTVSAPFGGTCYYGNAVTLRQAVVDDYEGGCGGSGCRSERVVIVRESGTEIYYYPDEVTDIIGLINNQ